ncbi:hypothetical protein, conserved [Leishmania donovani]|uniref:Leucine rich repeat family protein n=1 Tax=Leishmania donovani TaxID=5661 RepID=E9BTM1_LEIDO|nr:hypothetical protein, conserved [Leishmania donovani]TPP48275.1 Leucine rich repeat family protein [Leishmania donovani]CBZ38600.1 hypothetical protein, conserved [Leishmania donovani]
MPAAVNACLSAAVPWRGDGVAVPTPAAQSGEMQDLTLEELKSSLSDLGYNPYGDLVYTRSHLASKHLRALPGLQRYVHLQRLCVDDNGLTELDAVRYMPQLVHLHARHNRLTSDVFVSLAAAAAGCLEQLHLDDNCITSLDGLETLPFLLDFTCCRNRVQHLPARCLAAAERLRHFSLSDNALKTVDINAFAATRPLRVLDLSNNLLSSIDFLYSVAPQIEKVNIANNHVRHLSAALKQLPCLTVLDVGGNELSGLKELRVLRCLEALRTLTFAGNRALEQLSHHAAGEGGRLGDPLATTVQGTEYDAEVVMSDGEDNGGSLCYGGGSGGFNAATRTTAATTGVASAEVVATEGDGAPDTSSTLCSSASAISKGTRNADDAAGDRRAGTKTITGWKSSHSSPARVTTPTTAAYVDLAASETNAFVHSVGSARRDAVLDVRVHHQKEVLALPQQEQVYLWTLSVLPQLTEMNGRLTRPEEVAKAVFLFRADTTKQEPEKGVFTE